VGYFSNGTEGMIFEEQWCSRCVHSDYQPGKEIGDRDNPACPVWMAHLLFAYELGGAESENDPGKQILDILIEHRIEDAVDGFGVPVNECRMFHPRDAGAEIPGQLGLDDG
jgi:hypothetical protein